MIYFADIGRGEFVVVDGIVVVVAVVEDDLARAALIAVHDQVQPAHGLFFGIVIDLR